MGLDKPLKNNLRFADDIGLAAEQCSQAQDLLSSVDEESTRYGQEISDTKTVWMKITREKEKRVNEQIFLRGQPLEKVESFKYLGSTISADGENTKFLRNF